MSSEHVFEIVRICTPALALPCYLESLTTMYNVSLHHRPQPDTQYGL